MVLEVSVHTGGANHQNAALFGQDSDHQLAGGRSRLGITGCSAERKNYNPSTFEAERLSCRPHAINLCLSAGAGQGKERGDRWDEEAVHGVPIIMRNRLSG
jgi:hypothetical protein